MYIYTSPCTIFISRYYPVGWCKKLGDFSDGWRDCTRDKWWWNDKKFGWTAIHTGWWLVVSNIFNFSIIYGNNTPIWLIFFRGVGMPPTSIKWLVEAPIFWRTKPCFTVERLYLMIIMLISMVCCRFPHKPILNPLMKRYFAWAFHSWYIPWRRFWPKSHGFVSLQWGYTKLVIFRGKINGNSRILKWRYCTIFPYIGLKNRPYIWNRYLQSIGSWVLAIENLGFRWSLGTQCSDADGHQFIPKSP